MFYPDTNRTLTQILLSLWSGSTRRVEALPKVREYLPTERVSLVPMTLADMHFNGSALASGDFL